MFANVFFELANVTELRQYVELVNRHIALTDRRLELNADLDAVKGHVVDALESLSGMGPLLVTHLVGGEYDGKSIYEVYFPTLERPMLEIVYSELPVDETKSYPTLYSDATPAHFAAFIESLADDAFSLAN